MVTIEQVRELQEKYGWKELQDSINNGTCWMMEGHYGRLAMDALKSGACTLGEHSYKDYYGNKIPSIHSVSEFTTGSEGLAQMYWSLDENHVEFKSFCLQ